MNELLTKASLLAKIQQLMVVTPSGRHYSSGDYKHGWTNGKKHILECLTRWVEKFPELETREPGKVSSLLDEDHSCPALEYEYRKIQERQ